MDYSAQIKTLQAAIAELKQIKEFLMSVEDAAVSIEDELCRLDKVIPLETELNAIADPAEREQASHANDLLKEAYSLIDEVLGPPEDEMTGDPVGTAYIPEAKGNEGKTISIDEILAQMKASSKGKIS